MENPYSPCNITSELATPEASTKISIRFRWNFAATIWMSSMANESAIFWGTNVFEYWAQKPYLHTSVVLWLILMLVCVPLGLAGSAFIQPLLRPWKLGFIVGCLGPPTILFVVLKLKLVQHPENYVLFIGIVVVVLQFTTCILIFPSRRWYVVGMCVLPCFVGGIAAGILHVIAHSLSDP